MDAVTVLANHGRGRAGFGVTMATGFWYDDR